MPSASAVGLLAVATALGPRVEMKGRGTPIPGLYRRDVGAPVIRPLRGLRGATRVCTAPCNAEVAETDSGVFAVAGPRITPSTEFTLPPGGDVTLEIHVGRRAVYTAGWVLTAAGALGTIGSAATMTFADNNPDLLRNAGIALGASAGAAVTGIVMLALGRTRVRHTAAAQPAGAR